MLVKMYKADKIQAQSSYNFMNFCQFSHSNSHDLGLVYHLHFPGFSGLCGNSANRTLAHVFFEVNKDIEK